MTEGIVTNLLEARRQVDMAQRCAISKSRFADGLHRARHLHVGQIRAVSEHTCGYHLHTLADNGAC